MMKNKTRKALVALIALSSTILISPTANAAHSHCDQKTFTDSYQADFKPGRPLPPFNELFFPFNIAAAPVSNVQYCNYEISDITKSSISVIFTGGNTLAFQSVTLDGTTIIGNYSFQSGTPLVIDFPAHQNPNAFEFSAPSNVGLALRKVANTEQVTVTSVTALIQGNHYYLPDEPPPPVPEPLTILGTGVVLGAIPVLKKEYAKRNKKKDKDA